VVIKGIGVDLVAVERIERMAETWGDKFLTRVYTEKELQYCLQRRRRYEHLAGRFAAKESFIKASGNKLPLANIEVVSLENGEPALRLDSDSRRGREQVHLSITHDGSYALAMVIISESRSSNPGL